MLTQVNADDLLTVEFVKNVILFINVICITLKYFSRFDGHLLCTFPTHDNVGCY